MHYLSLNWQAATVGGRSNLVFPRALRYFLLPPHFIVVIWGHVLSLPKLAGGCQLWGVPAEDPIPLKHLRQGVWKKEVTVVESNEAHAYPGSFSGHMVAWCCSIPFQVRCGCVNCCGGQDVDKSDVGYFLEAQAARRWPILFPPSSGGCAV